MEVSSLLHIHRFLNKRLQKQATTRTNKRTVMWQRFTSDVPLRFVSENNCATLKRVKRLNSCQHHILILTLCHLQMLCRPTIDRKVYSSSKHLTIPTITSYAPLACSSGLKLMLTLFTQCLASVGVPSFSPIKICPKWPPQFAHIISVRDPSSPSFIAPGIASKKAGQPQPELNLCEAR